MTYEAGLAVALLLWFASRVYLVVMVNSRMERNLNKVGQRLSWYSLRPKQRSPSDWAQQSWQKAAKYLFLAAMTLPSVLLSWAYVAWVAGHMIYAWSKDHGAPAAVREFRWKLRNVDMPFDQLVREMMKVAGDDETRFPQVRAEILEQMRSQ